MLESQNFRTRPATVPITDITKASSGMLKKKPLEMEDFAYYNIRVYNDPEAGALALKDATYRENRTDPILENPSEYEIAVVRFSIPSSIPIFLWPQTVVNGAKTGLPDNTLYTVSIRYEPTGTTITKPVVFVDNCIGCAYPLGVYNYQDLLTAINLAYYNAFVDLKIAEPLMPPNEPPFLALDPSTQLISLYAEELYAFSNETTVWMRGILYDTYFPSFYSYADFTAPPPALGVKIYIIDYKTNSLVITGNTYLKMTQSFSTLALWNDFVALVLESDTIPIEPEFQPAQTNIVRRIITDFEPSVDINNRQNFQFFPQGAVRYYDLKSSYPMRSIDVRVYLQAKDGQTYLLKMTPGQYMSIKLQFRRKRERIFKDILDSEDNNE